MNRDFVCTFLVRTACGVHDSGNHRAPLRGALAIKYLENIELVRLARLMPC